MREPAEAQVGQALGQDAPQRLSPVRIQPSLAQYIEVGLSDPAAIAAPQLLMGTEIPAQCSIRWPLEPQDLGQCAVNMTEQIHPGWP